MYNAHNLSIAKIASKSSLKPALNAVALCGDKTIATDSFRLIEIQASGDAHEAILIPRKNIERLKLGANETVQDSDFPNDRVEDAMPDFKPVWDRAMSADSVTIRVNASYLAELCTILAKLDKKHHAIEMTVPTKGYTGIILQTINSPQKGRAILMPMNR